MANSQNFRSAFNGFNREDVVHYLEYVNSKHTTLVNQLSEEAENLRQKLSLAAEAIACDSARAERIVTLEQEQEELMEKLTQAQQAAESAETARLALEVECESLRQQLAAAQAEADEKCAQLEAQLQNQTAQASVFSSSTAMKELEAYRRAERIERMAQERADQIYRKTNSVLAEASLRVDQVASDIGGIADQVVQQLQMLQQAVTGSKQALNDAAAVMYSIRPENEEI